MKLYFGIYQDVWGEHHEQLQRTQVKRTQEEVERQLLHINTHAKEIMNLKIYSKENNRVEFVRYVDIR